MLFFAVQRTLWLSRLRVGQIHRHFILLQRERRISGRGKQRRKSFRDRHRSTNARELLRQRHQQLTRQPRRRAAGSTHKNDSTGREPAVVRTAKARCSSVTT